MFLNNLNALKGPKKKQTKQIERKQLKCRTSKNEAEFQKRH